MKAIITGANGTVGQALQTYLAQQGDVVIPWNRRETPINDYAAMESFVRAKRPHVLFHLATDSQPTGIVNESWIVNYEWTSELAWIARKFGVRFVFTSTVMVYTDDNRGPFSPQYPVDADEGYGFQKWRAEERAFEQNKDSVIARMGWQIDDNAYTNNILRFLETHMQEDGVVKASKRWYPACSFLQDTVAALVRLSTSAPGLYQIDSNSRWNFYQIASALSAHHDNKWKIEATDDFVYDQRMIDNRVGMPLLSERLPELSVY
jgi:dTDP-4-dehydrorhamnose reductase